MGLISHVYTEGRGGGTFRGARHPLRPQRSLTAAELAARLDAWLVHYNERRPKQGLGWMSPMEHRRSLGLVA